MEDATPVKLNIRNTRFGSKPLSIGWLYVKPKGYAYIEQNVLHAKGGCAAEIADNVLHVTGACSAEIKDNVIFVN